MGDIALNWWLSFYAETPLDEFELHSPWWISGYDADGVSIVVAAVQAPDQSAAWEQVRTAYDTPPASLRQRFIDVQAPDWSPFSERFPQGEWMAWEPGRTCACGSHK